LILWESADPIRRAAKKWIIVPEFKTSKRLPEEKGPQKGILILVLAEWLIIEGNMVGSIYINNIDA